MLLQPVAMAVVQLYMFEPDLEQDVSKWLVNILYRVVVVGCFH